jgi:hypothetical protein
MYVDATNAEQERYLHTDKGSRRSLGDDPDKTITRKSVQSNGNSSSNGKDDFLKNEQVSSKGKL